MKRFGQYPLQFQQFGGAAFGLPYGTATPAAGGGAVPSTLAVYGDSTAYSSGASSDARRWSALVANDAGAWALYNAGVPGQSISDMADGVVADTVHRGWLTIFMDRPNTGETSADWISEVKRAAATRTGYWFVAPPVINSPSGQPDATATVIGEVQAALLSDPYFDGHTFNEDEQAAYIAAVDDDATRAGGSDWTHFNDLGQALQANFVTAMLIRLGAIDTPAEATALIARMSSAPGAQRQNVISATFARLIGAGLLPKYDVLRMWAAHTEQAGALNWIADQYNAIKTGTVTFTTDRGRAGDGSTGYHSSGFNPATAVSPKFTQNSAHVALWVLSNVAENKEDFGGGNTLLRLRAADNSRSGRVNNGSTVGMGTGVASSIGPFTASRRDSSAIKYTSGAYSAEASVAATSAAPSSGVFLEGSGPVLPFSTKQIAIVSFGSGLTLDEMQQDYQAKGAYLAAIGAL